MIAIKNVKTKDFAQASFRQSGMVNFAMTYNGKQNAHFSTAGRPPEIENSCFKNLTSGNVG